EVFIVALGGSAEVDVEGEGGMKVAFLPRHGRGHKLPPHRINYRANLWALHSLGVSTVIGVNAVGGIHPETGPGRIAIPRQIIDYSWGREHTFFDGVPSDTADGGEGSVGGFAAIGHVDFTEPYSEALRQRLIRNAGSVPVWADGVYACTQGPRLESAAEVERLRRDGCDMIGMTGMPEAALARELEMDYACIALSVNWAAGLSDDIITMESIGKVLERGMASVLSILQRACGEAPGAY
ncbi:MAG: S-methyl-5'-thioinosine phosphorylase, partial [Pseudomonas sp.]